MVSRLTLLLLIGCSTVEEAPVLSPEAWVVRASLDLRGVRPSLKEIRRVHEDPRAAEELIASFIEDPRFGPRVADLWSELYQTRTEEWPVTAQELGLGDADVPAYVTSLGEEVPAVIARIAGEDLPWTELVLGDWTMANALLEQAWPVRREPGQGDWRVARYTDGRPAAGLLAANGMWWRYTTTPSNANRGRARQVARLFLCTDYSNVAIPFEPDLDLLDEAAVRSAIRGNPSCAGCHDALDPIAGYLYGFWYFDDATVYDAAYYHPERELAWRDFSELEPAVHGQPGWTLRDLGLQVAASERFPACAVQQAWELLLRHPPGPDEEEQRIAVRNRFIEGGLTARALLGALVKTEAYRSLAEEGTPVRLASPELMASQIEDLTGYRMRTDDGWDLMRSELVGLRGLAGGADGRYTSRSADEPNATMVLVQGRLAEAAALYVVEHDRGVGRERRRLLTRLDFTETPATDEPKMVEQLRDLHARLYGRQIDPDGVEVAANLELWDALHQVHHDPALAWAGLLTALLADPDMLLY
jgi:hypothetical protein